MGGKRRENFALWKKRQKNSGLYWKWRIHLWTFFSRWLKIFFYCPRHFFVQSFLHSLPWLFLWAYHLGTVCTACGDFIYLFFSAASVFLSAILTRGSCQKYPWQVVTAFTDACCVLLLWGCGMKKELFVCERTLLTDLCCAFLCTHSNAYCEDVLFFARCSREKQQDWGLLVRRTHWVTGVWWSSLCLWEAGKSEALLIHSCSHRERCRARVFPCSCRFSVLQRWPSVVVT